MKKLLAFFTFALLIWQPLSAKIFTQDVQLQLADVTGSPVANTEFWITVNVIKKGNQITINFPTINFQVGQCAANDSSCTMPPEPGYLITTAGFLPPAWRPKTLVPVSVLASAGDGLAQTSGGPTPPSGYIVLVDNAGEIIIQQASTSSSAIAAGPHIVLPCSLSYIAGNTEEVCFNFQVSEGEINVTEFTGSTPYSNPAGDNIRDSHINDAFDNTFAWAWTDNNNVSYTDNILNVFVSIGQINKHGRFKLGKPIQLTNFPHNTIAWDTSVAINRKNKNNIVVSYGLIKYDASGTSIISSSNCRAVSFDGGKTWGGVFDGTNSSTHNGLINYQTAGGFGDLPGVRADKFGNFWYASTDESANTNAPYLLNSTDGGVVWSLAFQFPGVTFPELYDYPHVVFGGDGTGQYGAWFYTDYFTAAQTLYPAVTFLPITGLGTFGAATTTYLTSFPNSIATPTVTTSNDGRFWALGFSGTSFFILNNPLVTLFKSPGSLSQNYAGPWLNGSQNQLNEISNAIFEYSSVPFFGYFLSVQGLLYDESRQALYALFSATSPSLSQNMRLYFAISRNNGQTWSDPYDVSNTAFANRGFSSMSLDPSSGNLYLGWYDGRNDPNQKKIQYFGGVIPAKQLDRLVGRVPLSTPVYSTANQGSPTPPP